MASAEREQVTPLAPAAAYPIRSDYEEPEPKPLPLLPNLWLPKYILCIGCITAFFLILFTIVLVLFFTVLHIKHPVLEINHLSIEGLDNRSDSTSNVTLVTKLLVRNPNVASFSFENITMAVHHDGVLVGETTTPNGKIKARRTVDMNVTTDLINEKIKGSTNGGELGLSSYTRIGGHVKILVKRYYVVVRMNCTMIYNVTSHEIRQEMCKRVTKLE